jgi:hypothetical protein
MEPTENYSIDASWLEGTVKELDKLVKTQEKKQAVVVQLQFANTALNYSQIFTHYGPEPLSTKEIKTYFIHSTGCLNVIFSPFGPRP